jgi:hypothetical protein
MVSREGATLLICYSSGDLGDVGRHCVALALKHGRVRRVRVITDQPVEHLFFEGHYNKCKCPPQTHDLLAYRDRLQFISADLSHDDLSPHIGGIDAVISCLGNRLPFRPESQSRIAESGTTRIVQALLDNDQTHHRLIMLSSVGIGNDWPPLEGLREGNLLQGFFRTICWEQYQDLSAAERALHRRWSTQQLDYVTARCVILPDERQPTGAYRAILHPQDDDSKEHQSGSDGAAAAGVKGSSYRRAGHDYDQSIAKLDAALFLVQEAVIPSLHRQVVILGGAPLPLSECDKPNKSNVCAGTSTSHS